MQQAFELTEFAHFHKKFDEALKAIWNCVSVSLSFQKF